MASLHDCQWGDLITMEKILEGKTLSGEFEVTILEKPTNKKKQL